MIGFQRRKPGPPTKWERLWLLLRSPASGRQDGRLPGKVRNRVSTYLLLSFGAQSLGNPTGLG